MPLSSTATTCKVVADTVGVNLQSLREWHARFVTDQEPIGPDAFQGISSVPPPSSITALYEISDGQIIAIDGKTLLRSFDSARNKAAIHMVSSWATANHT